MNDNRLFALLSLTLSADELLDDELSAPDHPLDHYSPEELGMRPIPDDE